MMLNFVSPNVCIDVSKRVRAVAKEDEKVYTWEIPFPDEFIRSKNKKSVQVISASVIRKQRNKPVLLHYLTFHSTFVQDATIDNNLICFADYTLYRALTFEQYTSLTSYKVWFENPFAETDKKLNLNDPNLVIKLELRYVY